MTLEEYLKQNGIKKSYFCEKLGITRNSLWNIMTGNKPPSLQLAVEIEKITNDDVRCRDWIDNKSKLRYCKSPAKKRGRPKKSPALMDQAI